MHLRDALINHPQEAAAQGLGSLELQPRSPFGALGSGLRALAGAGEELFLDIMSPTQQTPRAESIREFASGLSSFLIPGAGVLRGPIRQVFHFTRGGAVSKFKKGTFFAENPASEKALREGLQDFSKAGDPASGIAGTFQRVALNPSKPLDLSNWEVSRKLLKGVEGQSHLQKVSERTIEGNPDLGSVRRIWDSVFDSKEATAKVVENAQKLGFDSLTYATPKDDAGRVWIAVSSAIAKAIP